MQGFEPPLINLLRDVCCRCQIESAMSLGCVAVPYFSCVLGCLLCTLLCCCFRLCTATALCTNVIVYLLGYTPFDVYNPLYQ